MPNDPLVEPNAVQDLPAEAIPDGTKLITEVLQWHSPHTMEAVSKLFH